jgi:hypothetical protein
MSPESDTPRTEAVEFHIDTSGPYVWAHFAQQLEREIEQKAGECAMFKSRLLTAEVMIEHLKRQLHEMAKGPSGYMHKGYWYEYPKA